MVEQGTHKPLVGGSNPPSATTLDHLTAALPTRRAVSNPSPRGAQPSASAPRPYSCNETQDLRHGVLTGLDAILAAPATHGRRLLDPGGSSLNAKFFRNGIVMLVLVVGHRCAAVTPG